MSILSSDLSSAPPSVVSGAVKPIFTERAPSASGTSRRFPAGAGSESFPQSEMVMSSTKRRDISLSLTQWKPKYRGPSASGANSTERFSPSFFITLPSISTVESPEAVGASPHNTASLSGYDCEAERVKNSILYTCPFSPSITGITRMSFPGMSREKL